MATPPLSPPAPFTAGTSRTPNGSSAMHAPPPAAPVPVQASEVHTMPSKFLIRSPAASGEKKLLRTLLLILLIVIVLGAGVGLYARFFRASGGLAPLNVNTAATNEQTNIPANANSSGNTNVNAATNTAANTNALTNSIATVTATGALTDPESNEVLGTITVTIPSQALPSSVRTVAITALSPKIGAYATSKGYQPIGGVYVLTPSGIKLQQKATAALSYTNSNLLGLDFIANEEDLTVASWNGAEWAPINSVVDAHAKTVTADIGEFFTDGLAIVIPKPAGTNTNTATNTAANTNTNQSIHASPDADADGLTDQEELLYGTNANNADTDADTYRDGQEVQAQYNPNGKNTLTDSGLVRSYENATYRYTLLYPPSWSVGALNNDKLALFTAVTGEFVQVAIQENTAHLSAREWYLSLNPSVQQSTLKDIAVGSLTGVVGPDGLNVYLADKDFIYQLTYNIGIRTEANYVTTFTMMYTSFKTNITPSKTTNSNSNTNTAANTNTASTASERDAQRVADVRTLQSALELYYNDQLTPSYIVQATGAPLTASQLGSMYIASIPTPPTPADNPTGVTTCTDGADGTNRYLYQSQQSSSGGVCSQAPCGWYAITFCIGSATSGLTAGLHAATPTGME